MSCKWNGKTEPRTIPGRHGDDCPGEHCPGCQPCTEPHCRVCSLTHATGACAECLAEARDDLHQIARMCGELPDEVEHRGVNGEAMVLLGPAADPEAVGHVLASIAAGRLAADYLDHADHELHPLFVTGNWDMIWRDALDHEEPTGRLTLATAVEYLDRQLTYMAAFPHVPFEDFARDLRRSRTHLEAVLHDGEQIDRGAPCMKCGRAMTRTWGKEETADGWECKTCRLTSTEAQYRLAVMNLHREEATHLTDRDMEIRTGIKAGTVRVWAQRGDVERKRDSGRTLYAVADVLTRSGQTEIAV